MQSELERSTQPAARPGGALLAWAILALLLTAIPALGDDSKTGYEPLYDTVAVAHRPGEILLATIASPAHQMAWRFRTIHLPQHEDLRQFSLSADATEALLVFTDGTVRVLDLSNRITDISAHQVPPVQHRAPGQLFPLIANGVVCLVDDSGPEPEKQGCTEAVNAIIGPNGSILYAFSDGRLAVAGNGSLRWQRELPYRLPRGVVYQLLAGRNGDRHSFLVLVNEPAAEQKPGTVDDVIRIVDPDEPDRPLGVSSNFMAAALRAQFLFNESATQDPNRAAKDTQPTGAALNLLAERLDARAAEDGTPLRWTFYRLRANPALYAPVLEFAEHEPTYPSDLGIWVDIHPGSETSKRSAYEKAYANLGDERWQRCTAYVRTLSYPGTWLIEYWFYYPFDEGRPHGHFHDSEHLFVEVDKLGGTVRNIFASDHDSFVPNDIYSTSVKGARPVDLPLFAMVEYGKHAMLPDMNHDGVFTPGVDDNVHAGSYAFWGLRDRDSSFRSMMEPYRTAMSLPRSRQGRFALSADAGIFPGLDVPAEHEVCSLLPFPEAPAREPGSELPSPGRSSEQCSSCVKPSEASAAEYLAKNIDVADPENIYKPYVLPWREFTVGVGLYDWDEGREQISFGMVGDFRHMTGGLLPIPARLALEYGITPVGKYVPGDFQGAYRYLYSDPTMFARVQAERMVTNTQGFYFGIAPEWAHTAVAPPGFNSSAPGRWLYGGASYHLGYLLELPSAHKGNLRNEIGMVFRPGMYGPLFEWRVSFGFWRRRGRRNFGARASDRNPYEKP